MKEIWKRIDEKYEVSSLGRVRGPRATSYGSIGSRGYLQVCINRSTKNVHVLVAEAFLGPRPEGYHVCHKDGDKTNNTLSNLRYDTPTENWNDFKKLNKQSNHRISRTECPNGHKLQEPNLMPSQLKRGWRSCLACSRAHAYLRNGKSDLGLSHRELSSKYYKGIINENG